jgi:hypothetical protein
MRVVCAPPLFPPPSPPHPHTPSPVVARFLFPVEQVASGRRRSMSVLMVLGVSLAGYCSFRSSVCMHVCVPRRQKITVLRPRTKTATSSRCACFSSSTPTSPCSTSVRWRGVRVVWVSAQVCEPCLLRCLYFCAMRWPPCVWTLLVGFAGGHFEFVFAVCVHRKTGPPPPLPPSLRAEYISHPQPHPLTHCGAVACGGCTHLCVYLIRMTATPAFPRYAHHRLCSCL